MTVSIRPRLFAALKPLRPIAVGIVVLFAVGCPPEQPPAFKATFSSASDFYDRFDYGYSGVNPWHVKDVAPPHFHGDHNAACEAPTTFRDVTFGGDAKKLDFSQLLWFCAPGGDATKGHMMTAVYTFGYNHLWFSPKPTFTGVSAVCWDQNLTSMSSRKWNELQFVDEADAHRYPVNADESTGNGEARGTGGFDLGFTNPGFRDSAGTGPSTGILPKSGTLAGLVYRVGIFTWFQNQDETTTPSYGAGWPGYLGVDIPDKAARYKHCLINQPNNQMTLVHMAPGGGARVINLPGQIPQHPVRVVFHDANYDPPKADNFDENFLTWHWDNIEVFAKSSSAPNQ